MLKYGFWVAILITVLGFAYAAFRAHDDAKHSNSHGAITQQAGSCGSNTAGNNNTTTLDCAEKAKAK